jgi:hypothetical protein
MDERAFPVFRVLTYGTSVRFLIASSCPREVSPLLDAMGICGRWMTYPLKYTTCSAFMSYINVGSSLLQQRSKEGEVYYLAAAATFFDDKSHFQEMR